MTERTWRRRRQFCYSSCGKYRAYYCPASAQWMLFYPYYTKNKEGWQYFGPDCATLEDANAFLDRLESGFRH